MELFTTLLVNPIINVLVLIYQFLVFLHIPSAVGFSIILLTVFIRFILYPFTASQLKASKKMQKLTPHLNKIKELHKGDSKRQQEETMKLYKEHGVNPVAGCLPVVIQLPIIWALYSVLGKIVRLDGHNVVSEINKVLYNNSYKLTRAWDAHFFGIQLSQSPSDLIKTMPLIILIPVLTGVLQFIQSKMMFAKTENSSTKKEEKKDDFASAFQSQSLYIFPAMIGFFSYSLPLGLSLYWNTFTVFGILQQYQITGMEGLTNLIPKKTK